MKNLTRIKRTFLYSEAIDSANGSHCEKVLVVMVHPVSKGSQRYVSEGNRAKLELQIDLTPFLSKNEADSSSVTLLGKVTANLTGYISRVNGRTTEGENPTTVGHFISVTKSLVSGHFFCSDDLLPEAPKFLPLHEIHSWPEPYVLFYTVKCQNLTPWPEPDVITEAKLNFNANVTHKRKRTLSHPNQSTPHKRTPNFDGSNAVTETKINTQKRTKTAVKFESKTPVKNNPVLTKRRISSAATTKFELPFYPILCEEDVKEAD